MKAKAISKALVLAAALASEVSVAVEPGDHLSFVACPILRDMNIVPCWLAEYEGELYFLGIQTDAGGWPPPMLGHRLLVEGRVTDLPRVCGGVVLESPGSVFDRRPSGSANGLPLPNPPVTSVMRELDNSCRTILPEEERFNTVEPRRGPGPSVPAPPRTPEEIAQARLEAEARAEAERPRPPYTEKVFELFFEFDSELAGLTINELQGALEYAQAIGAGGIEVVGYRSSARLSDGEFLEEIPYIAELRAKELEIALRMLGLPDGLELKVRWEDGVLQGNGRDDWRLRKAEVIVTP